MEALATALEPQPHIVSLRGGPSRRWYAVYCGVSAERRVQRWLERLGYPTIVLLYHAGYRTRNMLPRYLFACFDIDYDPWREIEDIDGVMGFVQNREMPVPLPAPQVSWLAEMAMECLLGLATGKPYVPVAIRKHVSKAEIEDLAGKNPSKKPGKVARKYRLREKRRAKRAAREMKAWLALHQKTV